MSRKGIAWHGLRYHKRPSLPATLFDVLCGVLAGLAIMRRQPLSAVHARSHVAVAMGLALRRLTGCRLIFDIRGLMAQEYVDAGHWRDGSVPVRITEATQRRAIALADGIVVLTDRVRSHLFGPVSDPRVRVIPCCADLETLRRAARQGQAKRRELGLEGRPVLVYVGKFSGWYMHRQMVEFFVVARDHLPRLHFPVLTRSPPALIVEELARAGVSRSDYTVTTAPAVEVGAYLAAADLAISLIHPLPSKTSSSPTKVGEYLAVGRPVVASAGVGDLDTLLGDRGVGVLMSDFDRPAYEVAAGEAKALLDDPRTARRCREVADPQLSLADIGIRRYDDLYRAFAVRGLARE